MFLRFFGKISFRNFFSAHIFLGWIFYGWIFVRDFFWVNFPRKFFSSKFFSGKFLSGKFLSEILTNSLNTRPDLQKHEHLRECHKKHLEISDRVLLPVIFTPRLRLSKLASRSDTVTLPRLILGSLNLWNKFHHCSVLFINQPLKIQTNKTFPLLLLATALAVLTGGPASRCDTGQGRAHVGPFPWDRWSGWDREGKHRSSLSWSSGLH